MARIFMPSASSESIVISRDEGKMNLSLAPGEVDKASALLRIALGMEELDNGPSYIKDAPFVIRFFEDDTLALERSDTTGSLHLAWREVDDLMLALKDGLALAINERTLVKGPRGTGKQKYNQEPFI
jgi:hypothetical protein